MNKNIFTLIFFVLFIGIFSSIYGGEYFDFHKKKQTDSQYQSHITNQVEDFSLENIQILKKSQIFFTPNTSLLDSITKQINQAKERVYIEVYIFTEKKLQEAIKKAVKRGVEVRVILEKNPYMAYNINNKTYDSLLESGVNVKWSDTDDYALNHSKFIIIDEKAILSTGNLSYSTFTKNRDIFVETYDPVIVKTLETIFQYDFRGEKKSVYNHNLLLSPYYSRHKFETLFSGAKDSIDMYFQYFKDEKLINAISSLAQKGIKITAIVDKKAPSHNQKELQRLTESGVNIQILKKHNMHSKAILVDKKYLYVGSINFSNSSLDNNRELGILLKKTEIIQNFLKYFLKEKTDIFH